MVNRMTIQNVGYFRGTPVYVTVGTCSQSGFGTRRVRSCVAENCCEDSFVILRNAWAHVVRGRVLQRAVVKAVL